MNLRDAKGILERLEGGSSEDPAGFSSVSMELIRARIHRLREEADSLEALVEAMPQILPARAEESLRRMLSAYQAIERMP